MKRFVLTSALVLIAGLALAASAGAAQHIYVGGSTGANGAVRGFNLTADGGFGAQVPGSPYAALGSSQGLAFSSDGTSLYNGVYDKGLLGYAVAADGSLSPSDSITESDRVADPVITPDGRFLYVGTYESSGHVYAFSRGAGGKLTAIPGGVSGASYPAVLAMAPDGRHLFVGSYLSAGITTYAIGADGTLTSVGNVPTVGTSAIAVAPDGAHLYELTAAGTRTFAIAADGTLTSVGSTVTGGTPDAVDNVVSPDGSHLYVSYYGDSTLAIYRLGADGHPTQITGSPLPVGTGFSPGALAMNAAGTRLYLSDENTERTAVFSIEADGIAIPITGSPFPTGVEGGHGSIALTPDQPPVAAFTTDVNNRRVTFEANASTDPDGAIARYDWTFGDGQSTPNGGMSTTHRYGKKREVATLTVIDDAGCSTTFIAAGHNPYCNGSAVATTSMKPFEPEFLGKPEQPASPNVKLKLRCPVACNVKVVGRLKLSGKGVKAKKTQLEGAKGKLKAGKAKTLKLKIPDRAVRLASDATSAVARLKVAVRDDAGDLFKERHGISLR